MAKSANQKSKLLVLYRLLMERTDEENPLSTAQIIDYLEQNGIGAERKSIITQFLIEAAVICSIGGVIGIGIGCVGTLIAGKLLLDEAMMLPGTGITVGAFLFSVVLGIIFGMYPAIKASGLQPVVALRAD